MAACPNCGRQTLRTKDWACQWCGYPLISRAFKVIDKTFKELQEERLQASMMVDADDDSDVPETPEYEEEFESEPEPEPEKKGKRKPEPKQKPQPEEKPKFRFFRPAQPTQRPAPEPRREPEPPPRPVSRPEPRPAPPPPPVQRPAPPVYRPEPRPEPPPPPRPVYTPPPAAPPAPEPAPKAEIAPQPAYQPAPVPEKLAAPPPPPAPEPPRAKPEIIVEATASYISSVRGEDIREGMEISADDIDALFKADKAGTNSKLNGKTIVLKGVVEKVFIREHLDIRYIVVTGKRKLVWSDRCTFNKEDSGKASRLNEGDDVAIRGKYDGYGKNIIFKDCQVV